jgi:hypothetical protein
MARRRRTVIRVKPCAVRMVCVRFIVGPLS